MLQQSDQNTPIAQSAQPQPGRAALYVRTKGYIVKGKPAQAQTQTNALRNLALEHGYTQEQVIVFPETPVTATFTHDSALAALCTAIRKPEEGQAPITAIFVTSEDRFCRVSTAIEVTVFIETCASHRVLLITPTRTYDFTDVYQVALFRFIVQEAYQCITHMVTKRLQAGRQAARARKAGK